jgi:hypothetical protein
MIVGTTIFRLDGNAFYSPAFPRGGEAAVFTVETTHVSSSPTFVVTIQHRNEDDTSWADLDTFSNITAVGTSTKDVTGIKELVRLKFTFSTTGADDAVHIIVPAPAWRPY